MVDVDLGRESSTIVHLAQAEGVLVAPEEASLLRSHAQMVCDWNARVRLVGRAELGPVISQQTIPSLLLAKAFRAGAVRGRRVLDVGSGAGFPAIPAAILLRQADFLLVEATRKKTQFLDHAVAKLNLINVNTRWGRVETSLEQGDGFDCVSARAVGPPVKVARLAGNLAGRDASLACFVPTRTLSENRIPEGWTLQAMFPSVLSSVCLVVLARVPEAD